MGKRTWTNEEVEILYKYFPDEGIHKCVELIPGHTKEQIKAKIDTLKIKSNKYKSWTKEENEKLKEAWETYTMEKLLSEFPGRTYQQIQLHANWLGYHSQTDRKRKCDISFLDINNLNPISSYWWGFIMADGCIRREGQLIIQLKDADKEHLEKFVKHTKSSIIETNGFVRTTCNNKKTINEWMDVFCMNENAKTYFPPKLDVFLDDFIYFFIGFVDGDGCIWICNNYPQLKIELHKSWVQNLMWFARVLKNDYGVSSVKTKISKKGTAVLTIENRNDILKIYEYSLKTDSLDRKWGKLKNYKPKQVRKRAKTYEEYINNLKELGITSLKSAYEKNLHPDRGSKRFNVPLPIIENDLQM